MTDPDDFLASLDLEISKVTEKADLEDRKEKLQRRVRDHKTTSEARERAKEELSHVDSQLTAILWKPISNVAFFNEQHCKSCNSIHRVFLQNMQRQVTTSGSKVDRLVRIPRPLPGYANEVVIQQSETFICSECADAFGFDMTSASIKIINTPLTLSPTYIQEAPDGPNEED